MKKKSNKKEIEDILAFWFSVINDNVTIKMMFTLNFIFEIMLQIYLKTMQGEVLIS